MEIIYIIFAIIGGLVAAFVLFFLCFCAGLGTALFALHVARPNRGTLPIVQEGIDLELKRAIIANDLLEMQTSADG